MQRRTVGVIFICIAAFLYGIRYIAAAIFGSNVSSWDIYLLKSMLTYVGKGPLIISWIALIAGIGYLLFAEFESSIGRKIKEIKDRLNEYDNKNGME